jgi:hypothetical protein
MSAKNICASNYFQYLITRLVFDSACDGPGVIDVLYSIYKLLEGLNCETM